MKIRRYADNMIFIISREIRQLREGLLQNIFHFAFLNITVFRTQLWRSCHIIVTSGVGSGTFRQADNFHNATEMGKRVSSKPSLRVVPWITGFRNLISTRIIPLSGSEQLTGRLINICRISLRAFVREWNTGTQHEIMCTLVSRDRWTVSKARLSVSQTNIPFFMFRFYVHQASVASRFAFAKKYSIGFFI